jgi:NADPH:quinone reductase
MKGIQIKRYGGPEVLEYGELPVRAEHDYPLADAARAQADLEARKTTGKVLLTI